MHFDTTANGAFLRQFQGSSQRTQTPTEKKNAGTCFQARRNSQDRPLFHSAAAGLPQQASFLPGRPLVPENGSPRVDSCMVSLGHLLTQPGPAVIPPQQSFVLLGRNSPSPPLQPALLKHVCKNCCAHNPILIHSSFPIQISPECSLKIANGD